MRTLFCLYIRIGQNFDTNVCNWVKLLATLNPTAMFYSYSETSVSLSLNLKRLEPVLIARRKVFFKNVDYVG